MSKVKTLVVDNFKGIMTSYINGDINSGLTNVIQQSGSDPFTKPGQLTWYENPIQIDSAGSIVTDLIMAGKARNESGTIYVYCIGHLGRLYKIQVNDPSSFEPNFDNPTLLATLSAQSPTFTRGAFIDFFGTTERIYIGHDKGVTRIDFDGTNETFVGTLGSWTQNVPRPLKQYLGNLYTSNGANLAEILPGATVSTYTKLSPAFPSNTQIRDLDITPEGNYLQAVVTDLALTDQTSTTPNTSLLVPATSYIFKWNGSDSGYTSYTTYNSTSLTANLISNNNQHVFGFDGLSGAIYNPTDKLLTSTTTSAYGESPSPNATLTLGAITAWMTPLTYNGVAQALMVYFGTISGYEIQSGFYCPFVSPATGTETDVVRVPMAIPVSNFAQSTSSNGYAGTNFGSSKIYFSTLETSSAPTTKYKLYKWAPAPTGLGTAITDGLYQTQTQIFSKKIKISEIRIYGESWVTNNEFTISLIGSNGNPITNGEKTFTAGSTLTVGDDFAWWHPEIAPTYALALRITNTGTVNHTINKIEIDYTEGGQ